MPLIEWPKSQSHRQHALGDYGWAANRVPRPQNLSLDEKDLQHDLYGLLGSPSSGLRPKPERHFPTLQGGAWPSLAWVWNKSTVDGRSIGGLEVKDARVPWSNRNANDWHILAKPNDEVVLQSSPCSTCSNAWILWLGDFTTQYHAPIRSEQKTILVKCKPIQPNKHWLNSTKSW